MEKNISNKKISKLDYMNMNYPPQDMQLIQTLDNKTNKQQINKVNELLNAGDALVNKIKPKRGRKSQPPTEAKLLKQADVAKRNKYKHKINELANQLYKDKKINHPLFNKMFNLSNGTARIETLKTSYDSLKLIRDKAEDNINKNIFNQVVKHKKIKKINMEEVIDSKTYRFKYLPKPNAISRVFNSFYTTLDFKLPKNHDYNKWSDNTRKTTQNFMYNGEVCELDTLLYQVFHQQKYRFKINISFAFILIKETQDNEIKYIRLNSDSGMHLQIQEYSKIHQQLQLIIKKILIIYLIELIFKMREKK